MKLISMTDFVLEQTELLYEKNQSKLIHNIVNYAQFLKQPLNLEMFVSEDKVLFEGFDDIEAINYHISRKRNIEYLSKFGSIELTKNAIKQFL